MKTESTPSEKTTRKGADLRDAKIGFILGSVACVIGVSQMISGHAICGRSCWIITVFKVFLPKAHESMAGGLSTLTLGLALITWGTWSFFRRRD
jgi:hypothetical protein